MPVKEFREFFFRHSQVNSGTKPDQEVGYGTQYTVGGALKYNRFLAHDYPSQGVMEKFCESITFKLNPEDTADDTNQGLTRLATYMESIGRRDAASGTFSNVVRPTHLPQVDTRLRSTDTAVSISGKRNSGNANLIEVSDVDAAKLSIGDPIKGTGIPAGTIILDIVDAGVNINTIVMSAAASSGTNTVTTVTVEDTYLGIKLTKAIRSYSGISRTVYIYEINAATLPSSLTLTPQTFAPTIVDPTCPAAGGAVFFDITDTLDGNYLVFTHYTLAPITSTTFATLSGLAIAGAFEPTGAISAGHTTGSGVDGHARSHTNVINITAGQMLQIGVNVPNDANDSAIGNVFVTVLKLDY